MSMAGNVIANSTEIELSGTTLTSGGSLSLDAISASIIRTLAVGVSGSGAVAVRLNVLGNAIANSTRAEISGSTITAAGDVLLTAAEESPMMDPLLGVVSKYLMDAETMSAFEDALAGTPIDPTANILSLNVSVAGTGGVAINGAFTGNSITNTVATAD